MRYYFLVFLFFYSLGLFAQNQAKVDSLLQVTKSNISDKEKVDTYVGLAYEYHRSDSSNTYHYANKAIKLAEKIKYPEGKIDALELTAWVQLSMGYYPEAEKMLIQIIKEAKACNYQKGEAKALFTFGVLSDYQGKPEKAEEYFLQALRIYQELEDKKGLGIIYNALGLVNTNQAKYEQALEYYFKSLKINKEIGNKKEIALNYNNIGAIYGKQDNYEQALKYHFKSLKINKEIGNKKEIALNYNNIGAIYGKQDNYEQALKYHFKSLKINKETGNKQEIALNYRNIGYIYFRLNDNKKSLNYAFKSLELNEEIGAIGFTTEPLILIGQIYQKQKNWQLAKKYLKKGLNIAQETKYIILIRDASESLSQVEKELGNYQAAYEYHVLYKQMSDSLFNEEKTKKLTSLELNYEFEQEKDSIQTVNQTKQKLLEKDIENRQNMQIATFIGLGLSVALVIVLVFFFRNQKLNNQKLNQANQEIKVTNEELKNANEEIKVTNEELNTVNEEVQAINETLKLTLDTVEEQRDEILSSIQYAQRIQSSILPREEYFQSLLPEYFVFFKPRDVVSGDFYWLTKIEERAIFEEAITKSGSRKILKEVMPEKIILAAIDCTGHGVPGAFMSMVGNDLLNSIVKDKHVFQADKILKQLHKEVRQALQQKETQTNDGMDMALVSIDLENKILEFSGAKNPLIYIQNGELQKIKGDIFGIGGEQREIERVFKLHKIDISQPTTFYLFSDGFQDQFGGEQGRKFMTKRFRKLLFKIHQKPMQEQKQILENTLQKWMGKENQIDDILVIGVRV